MDELFTGLIYFVFFIAACFGCYDSAYNYYRKVRKNEKCGWYSFSFNAGLVVFQLLGLLLSVKLSKLLLPILGTRHDLLWTMVMIAMFFVASSLLLIFFIRKGKRKAFEN